MRAPFFPVFERELFCSVNRFSRAQKETLDTPGFLIETPAALGSSPHTGPKHWLGPQKKGRPKGGWSQKGGGWKNLP